MRATYEKLEKALETARAARAAIGQNRGLEKEQAREGYEYAIGEEVVPALLAAVEDLAGDLEARDVERLAEKILALAKKGG